MILNRFKISPLNDLVTLVFYCRIFLRLESSLLQKFSPNYGKIKAQIMAIGRSFNEHAKNTKLKNLQKQNKTKTQTNNLLVLQ